MHLCAALLGCYKIGERINNTMGAFFHNILTERRHYFDLPSSPRGAGRERNYNHQTQDYMEKADKALLSSCNSSLPHMNFLGLADGALVGCSSLGDIVHLFTAHQKNK